ncbi:MAG TPA: hypothetical protein VJ850_10015 [Candidatus Limnocylindrales bacterium]|nr:hypothetical protein [Candidatus Limnocylindrales bacterium]
MRHDLDHAHHDLDLVAGLAADGLSATEQLRARAQVNECDRCSALRDDLLAIAAATRTLPASPAPRDFRITAEQAAGLRRTSWVTRLLGPFVRAGSIARPLAATFTTLGLIGVFVAAALPGLVGAGASSAAPESAGGGTTPTSAPAALGGGVTGPAAASAGPVDQGFGAKDNAAASDAPAYVQAGGGNVAGPTGITTDGSTASTRDLGRVADTQPVNLLLWGSVTVLGVGLMLYALRFAGRRLR